VDPSAAKPFLMGRRRPAGKNRKPGGKIFPVE
jgi:hypothetical protein